MADEGFFGFVVDETLVVRPQLGTGDGNRIKQEIFLHILPRDLNVTITQIAFQLFQISVLSQGNIPDRGDIHGFTALAALVALTGSIQYENLCQDMDYRLP